MSQRQFASTDTSKWIYGFGGGTDGVLTISTNTTEAPIDSACTGTAASTALTATNASFANGQAILIHQTQGTGAGNWELNKINAYTAGTITTQFPLINTYASGAQVRTLPQYTSVTINSLITYTAKAYNGTVGGILAFLCNGTVTVTGSIVGDITGYRGGAATTGGSDFGGQQGEGYTGLGSVSTAANTIGGGGGGVSPGVNKPAGAGGAYGGNGTSSSNTAGGGGGGTGATAAGIANLTSVYFGGGAGQGAYFTSSGSPATAGGNGGGWICIIGKTITISGTISTAGGNGNVSASGKGGGGGGAGGPVLLKCQTATLGTTLVTAAAGTGGADSGSQGSTGGNGGVGRIHIDYLTSFSGTTSPTIDSTQDATLFSTAGSSFIPFL